MKNSQEILNDVQREVAIEHLKWLSDYARRVAQRQVVQADLERLLEIRMFIQLMEDSKNVKA